MTYSALAWPLHAARRASYYALGAHDYGWIAAWDGLLGFGVSVLCLWLACQYVPEVHDFADHLSVRARQPPGLPLRAQRTRLMPALPSSDYEDTNSLSLFRLRMIQCGHFC